jgi:hypothetical protein
MEDMIALQRDAIPFRDTFVAHGALLYWQMRLTVARSIPFVTTLESTRFSGFGLAVALCTAVH